MRIRQAAPEIGPGTGVDGAPGDPLGCPSAYESYGLALVEGLACGLPVVSTSTGGASVLVRHGVNGFVIERTTDAVTAAVRSAMTGDRSAMRRAARQTALDHSRTQVASRYADLAAQLVADSR